MGIRNNALRSGRGVVRLGRVLGVKFVLKGLGHSGPSTALVVCNSGAVTNWWRSELALNVQIEPIDNSVAKRTRSSVVSPFSKRRAEGAPEESGKVATTVVVDVVSVCSSSADAQKNLLAVDLLTDCDISADVRAI